MTMRTRAAVLRQVSQPLSVEEIDLDPPGPGEALVRLVAAGICHSDHHFVTGHRTVRLPCVLGHEGAGIVEAVGPGTTHVAPGDHVVQMFISPCGTCRQCLRGSLTCCEREGTPADVEHRMRQGDEPITALARLGSFSERTVCPQNALVPISKDVDLVAASLVACGISAGLGAALNVARVQPGETAAVFGVGGVGMAALQGAVIAGAASLVAIDLHDNKLDFARQLGATHCVNAGDGDTVAAVRAATGGHGVDHAIITVDHVRPEHIATAMAVLDAGGRVVMTGAADADLDYVPASPDQMLRKQQSFAASRYGGLNPRADIQRYLELYAAKRLRLDELITQRYSLENINDGFADMLAGRNIRGVVVFDSETEQPSDVISEPKELT